MEIDPLFRELADRYEVFLFDVYGVIHNGVDLIQPTLEVMKNLHRLRKSVGVVSNSPLLTDVLRDKLLKMGLPPYYQTILTAGGVTHTYLKLHQDPLHARLGPYCYFIGQAHETDILLDTPFSRVDSLEEAHFILMTSPDEWNANIEDYKELLEEALKLDLPFVCANPDLCQIKEGQFELRPGSVAKLYEKMGGHVIMHGKPNRDIFEGIFQKYPDVPLSRIVLVGDSLLTDIKASTTLGFDSLLLMGPLFFREMGLDPSISFEKAVHHLQKFRYTPTYVTVQLKWD